jgi:hypothetical protein
MWRTLTRKAGGFAENAGKNWGSNNLYIARGIKPNISGTKKIK